MVAELSDNGVLRMADVAECCLLADGAAVSTSWNGELPGPLGDAERFLLAMGVVMASNDQVVGAIVNVCGEVFESNRR